MSVRRSERKKTPRVFDSGYFLDQVIEKISTKYLDGTPEDDPVIDMDSLEIVDNKRKMSNRKRKEIGFYAQNTLQDLRQKSFRNKNIVSPLLADSFGSVDSPKASTPKKKTRKTIRGRGTIATETITIMTSSKSGQKKSNQKAISSVSKSAKQQSISLASSSGISSADNSDEIFDAVELAPVTPEDERMKSNVIMLYASKALWKDKHYQISCLKDLLKILREDDETSRTLKVSLAQKAMDDWGLPVLPNSDRQIPIILFNVKGEPNFKFVTKPKSSPLEDEEETENDAEHLQLSREAYQIIASHNLAAISLQQFANFKQLDMVNQRPALNALTWNRSSSFKN